MDETSQRAAQALMAAFAACIGGRGAMRDWQLIHTALFGAGFQIVVGTPVEDEKEKADEPDKSPSP